MAQKRCSIVVSHASARGLLADTDGYHDTLELNGKEVIMNWEQLEGSWKQLKGTVRQKWAKLTDNDLEYIAGKRDRFVGKLQERHGLSKEEAERRADEWLRAQLGADRGHDQHSSAGG